MQTEPQGQDNLFIYDEWFPSERKLFCPPEEISTADWGERHIHILKSSKIGPLRNENNPPLIGIMNAADRKGQFKNTRALVVCKGVQTGVTTAAHVILFRRMDSSGNNALLVMETEKKVRRISNQRIQPALRVSPRLAAQMSDNPDDTSNYSIVMKTGFCLNMGWAGSLAALASDPCETVVLDEVDKYEHAMNIEEAKDRITIYRKTGLIVVLSTPGFENGPIMAELANCDTIMDYCVECPDCASLQAMVFENFWWPDRDEAAKGAEARKRLANRVLREKLARYACSACGSLWDDHGRDRAVRLGLRHNYHGWKMKEEIDLPVAIGFRFPSWISPFKSLSDAAARWLKAQDSSQPGKLRAWYNNEAAEPFIEGKETISPEVLYGRREVYDAEVPKGALWLSAAVDVQKERVEVEVKGWGPGEESWGIVHKIIQGPFLEEKTQDALDDFLLRTFRHESGELLGIKRAFIDSGGYYTSQAYAFCKAREHRGVYAIKGSSDPRADILDGKLVKRKDAVFQKIGVTACKDILFGRLALQEPGAGYMHFPMSYDREYFSQFLAERPAKSKAGHRYYEMIPGRRNEAIDLNNYNLAALRLYNPDWETLRRGGLGRDDRSRLVYRNHDRTKHLDETIVLRPELPVIVCCDFGKNPLVWVLCQHFEAKVRCFDEITLRNASASDMGMEVLRRYGGHKGGFIVYGSATGTVRSPAGRSEYAILRDMGFVRQAVKPTNPPPIDRVNAVNNMLFDIAGQSRLFYNAECIMLRKDFEQAIWLEDMSDVDRSDFGRGNAAEALGFYINYEWPLRTNRPDPKKRFYK